MKFIMEIEETLKRRVTVDAPSVASAYERIRSLYNNGEVVLTADDHCNTRFMSRGISAGIHTPTPAPARAFPNPKY